MVFGFTSRLNREKNKEEKKRNVSNDEEVTWNDSKLNEKDT